MKEYTCQCDGSDFKNSCNFSKYFSFFASEFEISITKIVSDH